MFKCTRTSSGVHVCPGMDVAVGIFGPVYITYMAKFVPSTIIVIMIEASVWSVVITQVGTSSTPKF